MFSKTTEYALRATIYIAQKSNEKRKLPITEISKAIGSPPSFTAKILQALAKNDKIVSSVRGPGGGFFLSAKADKLPVMAVLEAMNEDTTLTDCVLGLESCTSKKPCPLHEQYQEIRHELVSMFNQKSIGEIAGDFQYENIFLKSGKAT